MTEKQLDAAGLEAACIAADEVPFDVNDWDRKVAEAIIRAYLAAQPLERGATDAALSHQPAPEPVADGATQARALAVMAEEKRDLRARASSAEAASAALSEKAAVLKSAAQELVDAISFDDNGALIGGKWMGGNGWLLSRETLTKADALRRAIANA